MPINKRKAKLTSWSVFCSLELIDKSLVYATESSIIDWSYQIQEALKKESSEPLLQGTNPNPKVELEFWENRYPVGPAHGMVVTGSGFGWRESAGDRQSCCFYDLRRARSAECQGGHWALGCVLTCPQHRGYSLREFCHCSLGTSHRRK